MLCTCISTPHIYSPLPTCSPPTTYVLTPKLSPELFIPLIYNIYNKTYLTPPLNLSTYPSPPQVQLLPSLVPYISERYRPTRVEVLLGPARGVAPTLHR